ncbi:MAG: amidohydrolase family protein, partial [Sphingomonadaceae bacterium]
VMGDAGHAMVLDDYAAVITANAARDRRFRLIHMWYPDVSQIARAGAMRLIADITPSHLIDQLASIDAALGPARATSAFPWASAAKAGMTIDIGSDWPGSFDGITVSPNDPLENIYYAVTRRRVEDISAGWHGAEALTIDQAIAAYTANPAYAAREEAERGTIAPGMVADLVVLSQDIRKIAPEHIPETRVLMTLVGGQIVYRAKY